MTSNKKKHCHCYGILLSCVIVDEVSMKWMDRPSVTEMDTGGVYEMDRQTKCQKNENATDIDKILYNFLTGTIMSY